jgi:hypothetical protein
VNAHPNDCACNDCVNALLASAAKNVPIEQQIGAVVAVMSDLEASELLPVLRTLQFVRDNQDKIRKAVKAP